MRVRIDATSRMVLPSSQPVLDTPASAVAELQQTLASRPSEYVELCARSTFSFLRGGTSPDRMMQLARAQGYDAVGLADFNGLYGMVRAWEEAKKVGVRLIVGAELALLEGGSLVVHVENSHGYANLCKLLTKAHAHARREEPKIAVSEVLMHTEGLWALALQAASPGLDAALGPLHEAFHNRLSVGVYIHRDGKDRERIASAEASARRVGAALCATGRVLFGPSEDKVLFDVLQCIREGKTLDAAGTSLLPNAEARLKSPVEMVKLFGNHPEWIARTRTIADACTFSLSELAYKFPSDGPEPSNARLRRLTYEGARTRYPSGTPEAVRMQIEKELALIAKIDVAAYFLSVHDIVQMARARDILCQGRGSAANSAVCFCLGVTAVDPARSNLLFERFLSEERHEPPDIDVDFEHERREEVIQDIYATYGRDRAAMVSEVVCYRGKSSLREVGKVFGFSPEQVDRLTSLVSYWDHPGSIHAKKLTEFGFDPEDRRIVQVLGIAKRMQGIPRHLSIHVGGFVISSEPLSAVAPIEPATMEGRTVIPWDKDDIDTLGFFKIDVLGLGMLTAIRKALALVAARADDVNMRGKSAIDQLASIPSEDPRVYDALCKADTVGVFQIESRAQMSMLPRLKPRKFYDLVIEVAIVRPGPIQGGMVHPYLRRRNGEEAVEAPHAVLEPVLARTLGVPLFQEQVMQIAIVGAGYTGGEADQLRRDMAAWRRTGNLARHRDKLKRGFRAKGISDEFAERLYTQIQGFGEYGFPESHAASFALLVYASSWLKTHYPAEFATALINSQPMGFYSPSTILQDAERHGVKALPLDVNESAWDLLVSSEGAATIRLGLRLVKGLGEETGRRIEQNRPYQSLHDLRARAALSDGEMHALAEAGALSPLTGEHRRDALWAVTAPREGGLFEGQVLDPALMNFAEMSRSEQLSLDYARTGTSTTDHPLKILRATLKTLRATDLLHVKKGARVEVAGLVICRQRPATASGVVFMTLEDETGFINLVLWAKKFEELRRVATQESLVRVKGRLDRSVVDNSTGTIHVIVESMRAIRMPQKLETMSRDFH
jgi:error-prone DNA polymerase